MADDRFFIRLLLSPVTLCLRFQVFVFIPNKRTSLLKTELMNIELSIPGLTTKEERKSYLTLVSKGREMIINHTCVRFERMWRFGAARIFCYKDSCLLTRKARPVIRTIKSCD